LTASEIAEMDKNKPAGTENIEESTAADAGDADDKNSEADEEADETF
jgi:hypothetical protein